MSAEAFSKLTIGETMVTTRAGARARTAPVQRSNSSSLSSAPPSLEEVECQSVSGIKYDIAGLADEVRKRARHGLIHQNDAIKLKYCKTISHDPSVYMFYIADDISLRMGEGYDAPECSCGANVGGLACKHIFWMLDRLVNAEAPDKFKSQTLRLATDGSTVQNLQPAEIVDNQGLENVANDLDCMFQDDREVEEIEEEVREDIGRLLSVFDPSGELPDDFRNSQPPILSEQARKYREFQELFTEFAIEDLRLFGRLRSLIDPTFQAHVFFDKINDRAIRTFNALDEYIKNPDSMAERYDVVTCAEKLRNLVTLVTDYQAANDRSRDVANRAAESLLIILNGVVSRNFNAYANVTSRIVPEEPAENNLFVCLIGAPATGGGHFVLDTLGAFPQDDVLKNHWEMLRNIKEELEDDTTPFRAPASFISTFRTITSESRKRTNPEPGGSSAKRPMK